jgi:hypothetical protein
MKFPNFFLTFVGHFCLDPNSESVYGITDLIESGSNPDPEPYRVRSQIGNITDSRHNDSQSHTPVITQVRWITYYRNP